MTELGGEWDGPDIGGHISGIPDAGFDWQVPMVKCDSRSCLGEEEAYDYCEYAILAVAASKDEDSGGVERRDTFVEWLLDRYPDLNNATRMPVNYSVVQVFGSSQSIDDYVTDASYGTEGLPKIAMAIVFEGNDPANYVYSLRPNSTNFNSPEAEVYTGTTTSPTTPDTSRLFDSFAKTDDACVAWDGSAGQGPREDSCTGQYLYNGVLTFQRLVGDFVMANSGAEATGFHVGEAGVGFVPFPSKAYEEAGFFGDISEAVGLLLVLGLLYPVAAMIGYIAQEKELRQKEWMKMMSVTESDIGWSWFLSFLMLHIITATLVTFVSFGLYERSEGFLLWLLWVFSLVAVIVFCMAVAAVCSKASRGTLIGLLLFFAGTFLSFAFPIEGTSSGTLALVGLHPVAAFAFGLNEIGRLEDEGVGLTGNTRGSTDNPSGYTFDSTLQALIFDSIFWGIVTWYLNRVIRPAYGQALPWYFPFTSSYWRPSRRSVSGGSDMNIEGIQREAASSSEWLLLEPVGETMERQDKEGKSIELRNLGKAFGEKVAVDGLSMSMYSGQVTALLGHNGAGKTTAINMLTGALAPTAGYALVAGKDIRTLMDSIRQDLGICLQHDCLFPQLTVREHVQFFSRLKGLYGKTSMAEAEEHVDETIRDVALYE